MPISTVNPATGELVRTFTPLTESEVHQRITTAHERWLSYRSTTYPERARLLRKAADILEAEVDTIARMVTTEMGKPIGGARSEALKCVTGMRFYADNAASLLADEPLADASVVGAGRAWTRYEPLGAVLAVMPWNYPLWQVLRFAAPSLMAGNVVLLKHASNVPQCAIYLQDVFDRAGFPEGCFQTLLVSAGQVEGILRDPRVVAATLTGSEPAGRSVAAICGDEVMHTVLELGGSDPFVVMPSADLDQAVTTAVRSRTQNNGQSCIAAKRFIVHTDVFGEFSRMFVERMSALTVGDPFDPAVDVGPLATEGTRIESEELVADAVAAGATLLCGGTSGEGPGWFYPPTVLSGITPAMRIHAEEAFGPVASLYEVDDIDGAIEIANATSFGLSSNAWTNDPDEQDRFVADLAAGQVFINGMTMSFPELPFGGIKRSGTGRELASHGLREFTNQKTVWIR